MEASGRKCSMNQNRTKMLDSWLALEHARWQAVSAWPDSARKEVLLVAICSSIEHLQAEREAASGPGSESRRASVIAGLQAA